MRAAGDQPFVHRVRVGYGDTDQGGVVHHAVYLRWLEEARVELLRARGLNYRSVELDQKLALPVVEAHLRYRNPARFDDELRVETRIGALGPATIRFEYAIFCGEATICEATVRLASVRLPEMRACRLPSLIRDALT